MAKSKRIGVHGDDWETRRYPIRKASCGIPTGPFTEKQFLEKARKMAVIVPECRKPTVLLPTVFKTGSFGWMYRGNNLPFKLPTGEIVYTCAHMAVVIIGSKEMVDFEQIIHYEDENYRPVYVKLDRKVEEEPHDYQI